MRRGFSLLEVLLAMTITLVLGTIVSQLLLQNQRVFHDQNLVSEMHQSARAAVSQTADILRMAGQGVPLHAASSSSGPREEVVAILSGSNATRINLRAGLAPTEASVVAPTPMALTVGSTVTITADSVSGLYSAVGSTPAGRFVYIWGSIGHSQWSWIRASIQSISNSTRNVSVVVTETAIAGTVQFSAPPTMTLEEATAVYFDAGTKTIRRTAASNTANPVNPSWAPANELATSVTSLGFTYYDTAGMVIDPSTLSDIANRARVTRVDIRVVAQTTEELSNHTRPTFGISQQTYIRNVAVQK